MATLKMDFRFMKRLARTKIALLKRADQNREVERAIRALNRSVTLLDDGCGGMGFRVSFSRPVRSGLRRGGKRVKRA